jgi:cellulose synthase/poly-beta-1,6-N-acetylglucosamine synthase-like glycosyltransferase
MKNVPTAVIVPAYNEEQVIVETLEHLLREAEAGEFEVTVVCNGCRDRTAEVTRNAFQEVNVIELSEASKTAAINAGLETVRSPKIVLLDSDIRISTDDCRALVKALDDPDADAAIGHMVVDDDQCTRSVKAYYRVWTTHPYVRRGKFAAAFAVSKKAMDRIGALPDVIADDTYLKRMIPGERTLVVDNVQFRVNAPRDVATLIRVRSRVQRGNRQLEKHVPRTTHASRSDFRDFLAAVLRRPALWIDIPAYLAITIASRLLALKPTSVWERDLSTRQAAID